MPRSFHFYGIDKFENLDSFETAEQLSLLANSPDNQETSKTKLTKLQDNFLPGVIRFEALHEYLVRLKFSARARGTSFREFVSPYKFQAYLQNGNSKELPYFIVGTKSEVAEDFVKRLNERAEGFRSHPLKVDFEKLRPLIEVVVGAWFRDMKAANLQSAGVFGAHVERSEEFKHAESVGHLGNLMISYSWNDDQYIITLTEDAGVVLFTQFEVEEDALKLILDIKEKLLVPCWSAESPIKSKTNK